MKIRTGFVSNSSSSSFVIAFPHRPKDVADVKKMLFGKQEWHFADFYAEKGETDVPTQPIAESVFNNIERKATKQEIIDSIQHGWFDGFKDYLDMFPGHANYSDDPEYRKLSYQNEADRPKMEAIRKKYYDINTQRAMKIAEAFMKINPKSYFVVMEFADNDGEGIEEHTEIFSRISHIRTSYH